MSRSSADLNVLLRRGLSAHQQGDPVQAESLYRQVLQISPDHPDALHLLGVLRLQAHQPEQALPWIEAAIRQAPTTVLYHFNLAQTYEQLNRLSEAEASYRQTLDLNPDDASLYVFLGRVLRQQDRLEEATELYFKALQLGHNAPQLHHDLGQMLQAQNQTEAARSHFQQAAHLDPEDLEAQIMSYTLLPILYDRPETIEGYRQRFQQGLDYLHRLPLEDPEVATRLYRVLVANQLNFHLPYQGHSDRDLQESLGETITRTVGCLYGQQVERPSLPPVADRIRVGYLSGCFYRHTVGRLALGWIQEADRSCFELYGYHVGYTVDPMTEVFRQYCQGFHHVLDLQTLIEQIQRDRLHILVILDIGLRPLTQLIAALRLAPVQCTTWLHPITSGLRTIDYFLSSDLMEPPHAEDHYTETLVRLPGLGIYYPYPELPWVERTRSDLGLSTDAVIYLCCQSLDKYLPQHDPIFAAIAQQVPQVQFVFLGKGRSASLDLFRQRLDRAFQQVELDSQEYCLILPRLVWGDYVALNRLSDVFLDSLLWSGGNTTLEAIACDLPVVTWPGPLMRGRHSYGILQQLGLTETIAVDQQAYVEIAIKLGRDPNYRQGVRERMRQLKARVFEDRAGIEGLEQFYRQVVQG